jgi:hypothetical protein
MKAVVVESEERSLCLPLLAKKGRRYGRPAEAVLLHQELEVVRYSAILFVRYFVRGVWFFNS